MRTYWITETTWAANAGDKKAAELTSFLQNANKKSRDLLADHNHASTQGHHNNLLHKKSARKKWKQLAKNAFSGKSSKEPNGTLGDKLDCCHNYNWLESNADSECHDLTLLQLLALNALDLTVPASDVLLKNRSNNWVQLSGHEGSFALAGPGTIWKKRCSESDCEVQAYQGIVQDPQVCSLVPKFYRSVEYQGEYFIEMQDLLYSFKNPAIMDIKMGTRTFLEKEVQNMKERPDLFDKMVKVDPQAPTPQERESSAITKLRYMQFRENLSSSSTLGFRIEGYKTWAQTVPKTEFKLVKTRDQVREVMESFLSARKDVVKQILDKVKEIQQKFRLSEFFKKHEVIGSSLLLIYDAQKVGVWMIDFAKTVPVPEGASIDHRKEWVFGNHEDGYLFGLDNLAQILENCFRGYKEDEASGHRS